MSLHTPRTNKHRPRRSLTAGILVAVAVAVAAAAVGVPTANAGGGNSENAQSCQHGDWQFYVTSDGTPFNNEGDCVSYAAQGGTLVPLPDLTIEPTCTQTGAAVSCTFKVRNIGVAPATGTLTFQARLEWTSPVFGVRATAAIFASPSCGAGSTFSAGASVTPTDHHAANAISCTLVTIAPGALSALTSTVSGTTDGGRLVSVTASVDTGNTILEANETNNTFSQTFQT